MKLVADSKDFSSDKRALGFTLLLCLSIPLMFAPLYLLVAPPAFGIPAQAALAMLLGGIALLVFMGLFLKGRGMLFKVPLRVFEEGVLIQSAVGLRPSLVPFSGVSAIELFYGAEGKIRCGCTVFSASAGKVRSIENFTDKNSLKTFTERIRPILEQNGFRMEDSQESGNAARFAFRRPISFTAAPATWRM